MIRKLFIVGLVLLFASAAFGARLTQKQLTFIDEFGDKITHTTLTSVTIINAGTSTNSTIYSNAAGTSMTNPIVTGLAADQITFWSKDADYKCTATDGTYTRTVDDLTGSQTRFAFPTYLVAMSSRTASDSQTYIWGSDSDVTSQWIDGTSIFRWTPLSDGVSYDIGSTLAAKQFVFHVYVGGIGGGGLTINEGTGAFTYVSASGAIAFDATGSGAFGVHTGAATGAITLGSGTSGAWAIDGTSTGTLNADDSIGITTTGNTADITVDATDGSVIVDSGEAGVDDAIVIVTTGAGSGMQITSLADIDITTTGTSGEDITVSNAGGSINLVATEVATDALNIDIAGGIDIDIGAGATYDFDVNTMSTINLTTKENVANAFLLTANSSTAATIEIFNDTGTSTTEKAASIQLLSDVGSIELWSGLNGADALNLMVDGDTASGITIFNDTGTGDESIILKSDVGGITLNAAAGSVDIEAVGADAGDIILNAGDDMTFTVAGDLTWGVTGTMSAGGSIITNQRMLTENVTASDTLTTSEGGLVLICDGNNGICVLRLPAVGATDDGLYFVVYDNNETAGSDVTMEPGTGDSINNASANVGFSSDGADIIPCGATFIYDHTNTDWIVLIQENNAGTAAWDSDGS